MAANYVYEPHELIPLTVFHLYGKIEECLTEALVKCFKKRSCPLLNSTLAPPTVKRVFYIQEAEKREKVW